MSDDGDHREAIPMLEQALFQNSPIPVLLCEPDGTIVRGNGRLPVEATICNIIPDEGEQLLILQILRSGVPSLVEAITISALDVPSQVVNLHCTQTDAGMLIFVENVTAQRLLEQVFEKAPNLKVFYNIHSGEITQANGVVRNLYGDIRGRTLVDVISDELYTSQFAGRQETLRTMAVGEVLPPVTVKLGERTLQVITVKVDDHTALAQAIDVTDPIREVELSAEVKHIRDLLSALVQQGREIRHELFASATAMKISASIFGRQYPGAAEDLSALLRPLEVHMALLNAMVDNAIAMRNNLILNQQFVNVRQLIDNSVDASVRIPAEMSLHPLQLEIDVQVEEAVGLDPVLMTVAIGNLVRNAHKYTPDSNGRERKIAVRARMVTDQAVDNLSVESERRWLVIEVEDTGIGVPPDEQECIWDFLQRATNASEAGIPGTGIGLSLVKKIATLHGGSVSVKSILGEGSVFSIRIPYIPYNIDAQIAAMKAAKLQQQEG